MKKSFGRMFVRSFLKSFLFLLLLISVGVFSYQAVIHLLKGNKIQQTDTDEAVNAPEKITEASVDDISKNLIYCTDKNGSIEKILLEIFHCKNKKLYYITIPVKTQFTMSDSLYKKLMLVQPDIPQIMKLSAITKYFSKDTVYDYGVLLAEDLLGIKISYYTVIPENVYKSIFTTDNQEGGNTQSQAEQDGDVPKEVFSTEYINFLKNIHTAKNLKNYLNKFYPTIRSNLTLQEKMNYFDSYCKINLSDVSFELIPGKNSNSAFTVDKAFTARLFDECLADDIR